MGRQCSSSNGPPGHGCDRGPAWRQPQLSVWDVSDLCLLGPSFPVIVALLSQRQPGRSQTAHPGPLPLGLQSRAPKVTVDSWLSQGQAIARHVGARHPGAT